MSNAIIHENMSNDEYHGNKKSISRSGIVEFMRSPFHYWNNYLNPERPKKASTEAMTFGSAFHTMMLEPHLFLKEYDVRPEGIDRRTKQGKADYEIFEKKAAGKTILTRDQSDTLVAMQKSVFNHPQAADLILNAKYEQSFFWEDQDSGISCKARPDILHSNMIVDLKTIADASPRSFQRAMMTSGYYLQGAMQIDGVFECTGNKIDHFICICIEKTYPFAVGVYIVDGQAIEKGRSKYKEILLELRHAIEHNHFPSYGIQTVGLPNWVSEENF